MFHDINIYTTLLYCIHMGVDIFYTLYTNYLHYYLCVKQPIFFPYYQHKKQNFTAFFGTEILAALIIPNFISLLRFVIKLSNN